MSCESRCRHRLVPCPRLPAAALNQRYGPSAPRRCISPIPAPQTGISNVSTPREGEAPAEPQTEPLAEPQTQPPAACQPTTEPCPQLIAIRNHPAKQLRRSPSTGSRSSPEIRGLSGIWVYGFPTANGFYSGSHGVKKRRLYDINSDVDPLAVSVDCQRGDLKCGVPEIRASHPL